MTVMTTPRRPLVNSKNGESVERLLTDADALAHVFRMTKSSFAQSIARQAPRGLTPDQWFWVHKLANEQEERLVAAAAATQAANAVKLPPGSFDRIKGMFAKAAETIKWPKIRFVMKSGDTLRLYVSGQKSRKPGSINVVEDAKGDNEWYGRIVPGDCFEPGHSSTPAIAEFLTQFCDDPFEAIKEYGRQSGRCAICHRELTDPESVARGIGPVCAERIGMI